MIMAASDSSKSRSPLSKKNSPASRPIDPQAIEALRALTGGDDSFLHELVEIFFVDSPQRIAEIEFSLGKGDPAKLVHAAHSLKGSSSNFGAWRLGELCERIEQLGRKGSFDKASAEVPKLKEEYARVRAELAALARQK